MKGALLRVTFTHVALYLSGIVADIMGEEGPPGRYDATPRATFTDPEVGPGLDVVVVAKQLLATFRG